jgi:aspartate kinase
MMREILNKEIDDVDVMNDVAIITMVGASMSTTPGVSGKIFGALGNESINVIAIAQGSSECGLSLVVKSAEAKRAVRAIHGLTGN